MKTPIAAALLTSALAFAAPTADVGQALGDKADFTPRAFNVLKHGMTPEQAGKVLPGAEKIDKSGFSNVKISGKEKAPVAEIRLYFAQQDNQPRTLRSIELGFDHSLDGDAGFAEILKACEAKYGPAKPEAVARKLVTWVGPNYVTAQLIKDFHARNAWRLKVVLPE